MEIRNLMQLQASISANKQNCVRTVLGDTILLNIIRDLTIQLTILLFNILYNKARTCTCPLVRVAAYWLAPLPADRSNLQP